GASAVGAVGVVAAGAEPGAVGIAERDVAAGGGVCGREPDEREGEGGDRCGSGSDQGAGTRHQDRPSGTVGDTDPADPARSPQAAEGPGEPGRSGGMVR